MRVLLPTFLLSPCRNIDISEGGTAIDKIKIREWGIIIEIRVLVEKGLI
jgi:hypothetical protein